MSGSIKWKADVKEAVLVFPWYNGWLNCTMEELSWRVNPEKVLLSPFTFRKINLYIAVKNCLEEKRTQTINGYTLRMRTTYISVMKKKPIQKSEEDENTNKRGTLLVVEDNKELRQYLVNGLSGLFNMLEAENGQKALDILKEKEVDLIVTDVMMPVMDGAKLWLVKQNLRTCHIPIYMLSAKADIKYQLEGLQVGADDYIAKPFSMAILKAKIMNMLRTRHRIFEHYSNTTEIEPEKLTNNTMDEELLRKAIAVIERNMDNVEFSTEQFAREMNMSRSNLHLKLKAITGKSAIDFIHKIRFNRACQLLQEGKYNVSEISFMVGYNTPFLFCSTLQEVYRLSAYRIWKEIRYEKT